MAVLPSKDLIKNAVGALTAFDEAFSSEEFAKSWKLICQKFPQLESALLVLLAVARWFLSYATLTPENSSLPPSSLQLGKKEEPDSPEQEQEPVQDTRRKKSKQAPKRKPGGQPGHKGTTLVRFKNPDETHQILPTNLPEGRYWRYSMFQSHQVVEVELVRKVIQYDYMMAVDANTGEIFYPTVPSGHSRPIQYGNSVKAMLAYLNVVQFIPFKRTVGFFQDLADFPVSQGTLNNVLQEFHDKLIELEVDKIIRANLLVQPVMHVDETCVTVKKETFYFHILSGGNWCFQHSSKKRGREAHDEAGILPLFLHVLVHDCFVSYFCYQCEHALCIVHLMRELTKVYETTTFRWPSWFSDYFERQYKRVYETYANDRCLPPDEFEKARRVYKRLCTLALKEMTGGLPLDHPEVKKLKKRYNKAFSLLGRLTRFSEWVLLWMERPEVPFSNNTAERDGRMLKIREKISNCFRKPEHAQRFGLIRSFLMTCQKHGITDLHQALIDVLDGKLPEFMKYPEEASGEQSSGSTSEPASPVDEGAEQADNTVPHDPAAAGTSVEEACAGEEACAATTGTDAMEPAVPTIEQSKPQTTASSRAQPPKPPEERSACSRQQPSPPSSPPSALPSALPAAPPAAQPAAQPSACNEKKAHPNGNALPLESLEIAEGQRDGNPVPIPTCLPPPARSTGIADPSCPG